MYFLKELFSFLYANKKAQVYHHTNKASMYWHILTCLMLPKIRLCFSSLIRRTRASSLSIRLLFKVSESVNLIGLQQQSKRKHYEHLKMTKQVEAAIVNSSLVYFARDAQRVLSARAVIAHDLCAVRAVMLRAHQVKSNSANLTGRDIVGVGPIRFGQGRELGGPLNRRGCRVGRHKLLPTELF